MNLVWTWLLCVSLYHLQVDSLRCNSCFYDTSLNQTVCQVVTENCTAPELKFCSINREERPDGSKTFWRGCVPSKVCEQDYCQKNIIDSLGRKSCNITCCQEDLCNRDGYTPPVKVPPGNGGHVSQVHMCFLMSIFWMMFLVELRFF